MARIRLHIPETLIDHSGGAPMVRFRQIGFAIDPDGSAEVPRWAVPALLAKGAVRVDEIAETIDPRAELQQAEGHDLSAFLNAHGVRDHRTDYNTHYLSDFHRKHAEHGCPNCGHKAEIPGALGKPLNLHAETASTLDSFHQTVNGVGRIVILSDDEKRAKALELFDKQQGKG